MTNFRDLANRTLDCTYRRLGEAATYYPFASGMLQTGRPASHRHADHPGYRGRETVSGNTKIGVAVAAVDNFAGSTIGSVRLNGAF